MTIIYIVLIAILILYLVNYLTCIILFVINSIVTYMNDLYDTLNICNYFDILLFHNTLPMLEDIIQKLLQFYRVDFQV
jgi:hypothetical protein